MAIRKARSSRQRVASHGSWLRPAALALTALTLAACGGGGGGLGGANSSYQDASTGSGGTTTVPAGTQQVTLAWHSSSEQVLGYQILSGPSPDMISDQIHDVSASDAGKAPTVVIDLEKDLGVNAAPGDTFCFAVQAYSDGGYSSPSTPVCATI